MKDKRMKRQTRGSALVYLIKNRQRDRKNIRVKESDRKSQSMEERERILELESECV